MRNWVCGMQLKLRKLCLDFHLQLSSLIQKRCLHHFGTNQVVGNTFFLWFLQNSMQKIEMIISICHGLTAILLRIVSTRVHSNTLFYTLLKMTWESFLDLGAQFIALLHDSAISAGHNLLCVLSTNMFESIFIVWDCVSVVKLLLKPAFWMSRLILSVLVVQW